MVREMEMEMEMEVEMEVERSEDIISDVVLLLFAFVPLFLRVLAWDGFYSILLVACWRWIVALIVNVHALRRYLGKYVVVYVVVYVLPCII